MDELLALDALAALAQPTRLAAFRTLVAHEPDGLPAGDLARALNAPQNTLSTHLSILARAGLVEGQRQGRSVIYRAKILQLRALLGFLLENCCGGDVVACAPPLADIFRCAPSPKAALHD